MGVARVMFAVGRIEEARAFAALAPGLGEDLVWLFPATLPEVESLFSSAQAEAIVTDFHFHSGAFVDWLSLWPLPALILTEPGDDLGRISRAITDEASLFLERDPEGKYLAKIPLLVRKCLNVRASIMKQNAHVQLTERQYMSLLQAVPDVVYMLDADGRFVYLNDSVRSLGFEPSWLIGRHFSEIVHPEDLDKVSREPAIREAREKMAVGQEVSGSQAPKIFDERRTGKRMTRNLELRLKHGGPQDLIYARVNAYGEVSATGFVIPAHEGSNLGTVGIIRDVTERRAYEHDLEEALRSQDVLLKEVHHRVKNNLQVISSLLNLQENAVSDEGTRLILLECQSQIQSMAMVHEVLYGGGDFDSLDMQSYFERLLDWLGGMYEGHSQGLALRVSAEGIDLPLDAAIPLALIVNELVTNALKHAFPGGRKGTIQVSMREEGEGWRLEVADDGVGDKAGHEAPKRKTRGIGRDLVLALADQLRGKLETGTGEGTRVSLVFPKRSVAPSALV